MICFFQYLTIKLSLDIDFEKVQNCLNDFSSVHKQDASSKQDTIALKNKTSLPKYVLSV